MIPPPPTSTLFPYTTLFRSIAADSAVFGQTGPRVGSFDAGFGTAYLARVVGEKRAREVWMLCRRYDAATAERWGRSEEHTSELQSLAYLVCRLLLEKKKQSV